MPRTKLKKFAEFEQFPNTLSFPEHVAGTWQRDVFSNTHPLTVELACGHGAFLVEMARRYPQRNFVGIDIKGARLWQGAADALAAQLPNIRFLRADIGRLHDYFMPGEINELWITFPDPFSKKSDAKRRLTAPRFLAMYGKLLARGSVLHLKTDDRRLFEYSLQTTEESGDWQLIELLDNVYAVPHHTDLDIISRYEAAHLTDGKRIYYARWRRR